MKKSIAVIVPGTGYTCEEELLVGCAKRYESFGYYIVKIDFSEIPFIEIETIEKAKTILFKEEYILHLQHTQFFHFQNK